LHHGDPVPRRRAHAPDPVRHDARPGGDHLQPQPHRHPRPCEALPEGRAMRTRPWSASDGPGRREETRTPLLAAGLVLGRAGRLQGNLPGRAAEDLRAVGGIHASPAAGGPASTVPGGGPASAAPGDATKAGALKPANGFGAKVSITDLSFFYGTTQALRDVSIELLENRVTAIIGPSGCGKSTLIKSINRIAEVGGGVRVEGDVRLDGRSILDRTVDLVDLRRRVGMVFQKPNPFPKSIYENVVFGPRL